MKAYPVSGLSCVDARLLGPARALGQSLPVIGVSPPPTDRLLIRAADGSSWVASDYRLDPSMEEYGGVVVPRDVATFLADLRAAGGTWDRTVIAHEVPPGWSPERPLPALVPEPRTSGIRAAELATDLGGVLLAATARAAGRLAVAAGRGAVSGAAALAVAMTEAIVLDPVIIAGIELPERPLVAWVELARWSW